MLSLSQDWMNSLVDLNQNGITIFVVGILFTLSIYHFMLYFQHKDKAYLYYALYTFLVLLHSYYRADSFFLKDFLSTITPTVLFLHAALKWAYSIAYLLFVITLIDLYKHHERWNRIIEFSIKIFIVLLFIFSILSLVFKDKRITEYPFNYVILPLVFIVSIVLVFFVYKTKSTVKYYLLIGFSFFLITAVSTQVLSFMGISYRFLFYAGVVFESTLFALGLGAKQHKILEEKNKAQEEVIAEHELNIKLQNKMKAKLDEEVAAKTDEILILTKKNQDEELRKLEIEYARHTLELRMRALQTQMNPHFLFNALNSIKHFIIKNKTKDAAYFLSKLSKLIRKILDNSQRKEITLQEELDIMNLYLEVENIRLQKKIDLTIETAPNVFPSKIKIPPIVLQPFIENAIWHGLSLKEGKKTIQIKVTQEAENSIVICITDNGIGRERAAINKAAKILQKESLGIDLTKERLKAFSEYLSGAISIRFEDLYYKEQPAGTKVYIKIPIA